MTTDVKSKYFLEQEEAFWRRLVEQDERYLRDEYDGGEYDGGEYDDEEDDEEYDGDEDDVDALAVAE